MDEPSDLNDSEKVLTQVKNVPGNLLDFAHVLADCMADRVRGGRDAQNALNFFDLMVRKRMLKFC